MSEMETAPPKRDPGLQKAIDACGGKSNDLAAKLRVTPQALSQWKRVPLGRILDVERVSGVPRAELRPDMYSTSENSGAAA